jgi:hypothetical protein
MLKSLLKWQNLDSTQDLNARFKYLFNKGFVSGGLLTPVPLSLQLSVGAFFAMSDEGMLITEDATPSTPVVTIPAGQTSVVSVFCQYQIGADPILSYQVNELSVFNALLDKNLHVVIGSVTLAPLATSINASDISYEFRDVVDKLGRSELRGRLTRDTFSQSGDTSSGSDIITNLSSTATMAVGAGISGPGLQANTQIAEILSGSSIQITNPATATQVGSVSTIGDTVISSAVITNIPSTLNITVGMEIVSLLFPPGTTVFSVDSGTQVTASNPSVSTQAAYTLDFYTNFVFNPVLPYLNNRPGDMYVVCDGTGDIPELFGWDGTNWTNMTNVLAITADFAAHRANLFVNEKHLTDNEKDAALGTYGSPSLLNRFVTDTDLRVPTQSENDALVGSTGTPSSTNKYVTEEYPVAAATEVSFLPPGGPVTVASINGPVYVGNGAVNSANKFFMFLDTLESRAFINALEISPKVTGVFKDFVLLTPLNPAVDADANGFFTGDLYLQTSSLLDNPFRLLYGKQRTLKNVLKEFTVKNTPGNETAGASVVQSIVNIKGRPYDGVNSTVPTREQNINLRKALDSMQSYLGSVLDTNMVADGADFEKLSQEPDIGSYFVRNVGIADSYIFSNTGLVGVNSTPYNPTTGRVTYNSAVNLSLVQAGDVFIDGALNKFYISLVNDASDYVEIRNISNGSIPSSIISFPNGSNPLFGSIAKNFNPRDVLLSEMKLNVNTELLRVNAVEELKGVYSQPDGFQVFGFRTPNGRIEPRVQLYGSWQTITDSNLNTFARNIGYGGLIYTGFVSDLVVLLKRRQFSPPLDVSVNERFIGTVSTSYSGSAGSIDLGSVSLQKLLVASGLSLTEPTTVRLDINTTTADPFDFSGLEVVYNDSNMLLETGVAFDNTEIVQRSVQDSVSVPTISQFKRGGTYSFAVTEQSYSFSNNTLTDTDQVWTAAVSGVVITITSDPSNLRFNYKDGDLIEIWDTGVTSKVIRKIASHNYGLMTFNLDSVTGFPAATSVQFRHVCSTDISQVVTPEDQEAITYNLVKDFVGVSSTDFRTVASTDRYMVAKDGLTTIAGQSLAVVDSGIAGVDSGIQVGLAGNFKISALATRIDIVVANSVTAAGVQISIDNSPSYSYTITGGSAKLFTVMCNAKYQTHEIVISGGGGNLIISEVIIHTPKTTAITDLPVRTADLVYTASYKASDEESPGTLSASPTVLRYSPRGGVFYQASHYMSFNNGVGVGVWSSTVDFSKSIFGAYTSASNVGAYAEFGFYGTVFELMYLTGPTFGTFTITIDGSPINPLNKITTDTANLVGSTVNAFNATYSRQLVGQRNLTRGWHTVRMTLNATRMALMGYYTGCMSGTSSLQLAGYNNGTYTGVVDNRKFLVKPDNVANDGYLRNDIIPYSDNIINIGGTNNSIKELHVNKIYNRDKLYMSFDYASGYTRWNGTSSTYYEQSGLQTVTLADNTVGGVALSVPLSASRHLIIGYSIERGGASSTGIINLATDGIVAASSDSGVATAVIGVNWSADISGAQLRLKYTTTATGNSASMKFFFMKWI